MKINQFDRANLRGLTQALEAALGTVAKEYGISIQLGRGGFTSDMFKVSVVANTVSNNASTVPVAAFTGSFDSSLIGRKFRFRGSEYTIAGFKPNRPKFPVIGTSARGTKYKFQTEVLNNLI